MDRRLFLASLGAAAIAPVLLPLPAKIQMPTIAQQIFGSDFTGTLEMLRFIDPHDFTDYRDDRYWDWGRRVLKDFVRHINQVDPSRISEWTGWIEPGKEGGVWMGLSSKPRS